MASRHSRITISGREELHVFANMPDLPPPYPTVILIHGTTGSGAGGRRWRLRFARQMVNDGYAVINFDHRGCGYSDGEFEDSTVSTRIEDLSAVIKSLKFADSNRIGLFGVSLGSAIAILTDNMLRVAKTMVLYTLPCEMSRNYPAWFQDRLTPEEFERFRAGEKMFAGEEFFRHAFLDDLRNHDVISAIGSVDCPLLLIQPTRDEQVASAISLKAFGHAPCDRNKIVSVDGEHTFASNELQEGIVIDDARSWFQKNL